MSDRTKTGKLKMSTTALVGYYGSDRTVSNAIGAELVGCKWVCVPCCGGLSAVTDIAARSIVCSDLHRHVINAALVVKDPVLRQQLYEEIEPLPLHPDVLAAAQSRCLAREKGIVLAKVEDQGTLFTISPASSSATPIEIGRDVAWAADYLTCAWMGHGGTAGTPREFTGGLSVRWDAEGGDSNTRWRSFISSIEAFGEVYRRCNFEVMDVFEALATVRKRERAILKGKNPAAAKRLGVYIDAPWPEDGNLYTYPFTIDQQRELARQASAFEAVRVVIRFGDHPLIRELYPETGAGAWTWRRLKGRNNANKDVKEVLILNGPSRAKAAA